MYKIILSLGSNNYSKLNIDKAKRVLSFTFPEITFSRSILSLPDDDRSFMPFRNVLGVFYDDIPIKDLMTRLKEIEIAIGRQPKDKETGKVVIDIDLLQYGSFFTREEDINKDYIQELLGEMEEIEETEETEETDSSTEEE